MKIVIVGGVAGGASAAARIRRLDEFAEILLFERGEEVSYANCGLPYVIGGVITEEEELFLQTPDSFWTRFRVQVRVHSEVTEIDRKKKRVRVRNLATGQDYEETYDKLVLSPGAEAFLPPVEGIGLPGVLTLRSVADLRRIRRMLKEKKRSRVLVVGGGFIGLEAAENLKLAGMDVTVLEGASQIFPPFDEEMAGILKKEMNENGIPVILDAPVKRIKEGESDYEVVYGSGQEIRCDWILMAVGVRPESRLAREAGLEGNGRGGIVVDSYLRTSDKEIYAVGDAIEVKNQITGQASMLPLAGPANRQGRIAGANAAGAEPEEFSGVIGTSVAKIFGLTAACTGLNERTLKKEGIPYQKVYLSPLSHAGYYPGGEPVTMKLLFSPAGRVLGCQCAGREGVDKRIDVIAAIMKKEGTVSDLANLELCYAPPYSSAKDPVNYAGFLAENVISGRSPIRHWEELREETEESRILLDVRTREEYEEGHLGGSIHIPLDELRERIQEIPEEKDIWIYCQVGLRGYLAQRILMQRRKQKVFNLSGGYRLLQVTGRGDV